MTIETARRASLEFVCVFGQDAFAPSYNEVTAEIARVHALPLIDLYHDFKNRKSFFQDESHFTAEGARTSGTDCLSAPAAFFERGGNAALQEMSESATTNPGSPQRTPQETQYSRKPGTRETQRVKGEPISEERIDEGRSSASAEKDEKAESEDDDEDGQQPPLLVVFQEVPKLGGETLAVFLSELSQIVVFWHQRVLPSAKTDGNSPFCQKPPADRPSSFSVRVPTGA